MLNKYFQQELSNFREIAGEFSKENPAIAPMLGDPSSDPDVERLLESVAFLTGSIREKIDDEFPEIIHDLLRQIWPHYLRPLPSSTIIGFRQDNKDTSGIVPKGAYVDSEPVQGSRCRFQTCSEVEVHPVLIKDATYSEPAGKNPVISLNIQMLGITADRWNVDKLSFYLGGNNRSAFELYHSLLNKLSRIVVRDTDGNRKCIIDKSYLKPKGFSEDEVLIPYPSNSFRGYRLIQEYFHMPEKFLFLELSGWENWTDRESITEFFLEFELESELSDFVKIDKNSFILSATPAVNIFSHPAAPVLIDHKKTEYKIRPAGDNPEHYQIYSVEKVSGFIRGVGGDQEFQPFHSFKKTEDNHIYNEKIKKSPVYDKVDFSVSLAYPPGVNSTDLKTLSFEIQCTNGNQPELIAPEGICVSTTGSIPEFVKFKNLIRPTTAVLPPLGTNMLWRLVSLLTLNSASLSKPENLKTMLNLYLMKEGHRDKKRVISNEKRIDGIKNLRTRNVDRLVNGTMMRGLEIKIKISRSNFAGTGDLYLFGTVLDHFIGLYASINTFTRLIINEADTGEIFLWPERIGSRQII